MFEVQRRRGTSDVTIRTVRPALIRKVTLLEIVHLLHIHPPDKTQPSKLGLDKNPVQTANFTTQKPLPPTREN